MKKKNLLRSFMFFSLISSHAMAENLNADLASNDIKSPFYSLKADRVAFEEGNDKFVFNFCNINGKPIACSPIGRATGYTQSELDEIAQSETTEAYLKTAGIAALSTVGGFVGFLYLGGLQSIVLGGSLFDNVALLSGTFVGGSLPFMFNKIDPRHQFKQADVFRENYLGLFTNKEILTNNEQLLKVYNLLNEVLPKN